MRTLAIAILGSLFLLFVPTGSPIWGQQLTFTTIDVPGLVYYTVPYGINDAGQIVGVFQDLFDWSCDGYPCYAAAQYHGFLFSFGTVAMIINGPGANFYEGGGYFCSCYTYAYGVNAAGQIVGVFNDGHAEHSFLLSGDTLTTIDILERPYGINATGQIVGTSNGRSVLLSGDTLTTIDVPGAAATGASAINDAAQIVGWFADATGQHGFLLRAGLFATFDVPGAVYTEPHGINATGQIVGVFADASYVAHGFLLSDGTFTTIDVPGAITGSTNAYGINAAGQIVGSFTDTNNVVHGFLASLTDVGGGDGVDTTAPTVAITAPASGTTVTGAVTVSAAASDNISVVGVQFKLDGANLGAEVTAPSYAISWNTKTSANGTHALTASARDAAGNMGTAAPINVTVANDTTAPKVSITAPASGATVRKTITISATATDNVGVVGVQFKLDGANLGAEVTTAPYAISWNTTTAPSEIHTLTAVARDAAGNTSTSSAATVTVKNPR